MWEKVGEAVLGNAVGNVFGTQAAKAGSEIDVKAKLGHESALWDRAQQRGLTPQEYYGSSAPGGATGSSGAAQILGNSQNATAQQMTAAGLASREREKDRQNAVQIAEIQAGVQTAGQQIQREQLELSRDQYQNVTLPQAAKDLALTAAQTNKVLNEVATSDPKFMLGMKRLTMGVDNLYVEALVKQYGVDPTQPQPQWDKIPKEKRAALMAALNKARSATAKEAQGLAGIFRDLVDSANEDLGNRNNVPSQPMSQSPPERLGNGKIKLQAPGGVKHNL